MELWTSLSVVRCASTLATTTAQGVHLNHNFQLERDTVVEGSLSIYMYRVHNSYLDVPTRIKSTPAMTAAQDRKVQRPEKTSFYLNCLKEI